VPASIKLQEQYGDAIQVIFVESQSHTREDYESFAWRYKWMGNLAMWTEERPIPTVGTGLPETALIGIDGKVIMQGNPGGFGKKLEAAIAAEIKKSKEAPAGTPDALKKAWSSYLKGDVAAAIAECDKLGTDEAKAARAQFLASAKQRIARTKWLIDNGYVTEAEKLGDELTKGVKGCADLEPLIATQVARLTSTELTNEREAAKAWSSFVDQVAKKKPFDDGNVKRAESLGKKYAGTKNGERAAHLAELAKVKNA
jgi:hypothetical protein